MPEFSATGTYCFDPPLFAPERRTGAGVPYDAYTTLAPDESGRMALRSEVACRYIADCARSCVHRFSFYG